MAVQFLVNGIHPDGSPGLVSVTREEWVKIVSDNENLPKENRRYFYRDAITDGDAPDYIFMEVTKEVYDEWQNQIRQTYRNYEAQKAYSLLSLEELLENGVEEPLDKTNVEDIVIDKIFSGDLRKAVQYYSPWASELLKFYLAGKEDLSIGFLMKQYNFSRSRAFFHKQQFELFIKNFLEKNRTF